MRIEIINAQPTTEEEIRKVEQVTGLKMIDSLKEFVLQFNGGIPRIKGELCILDIVLESGSKTESYIESFVSMQEVTKQWGYLGHLEELAEHFELKLDYVETDKLFPVAKLSRGGVYMALGGQHEGKIYTADNGDFGILYHSCSLNEFLESLYCLE